MAPATLDDQPIKNPDPNHIFVFLVLWGIGAFAGYAYDVPAWGVGMGLIVGLVAVFNLTKDEAPNPPLERVTEKYQLYLDGKVKRYYLMFAVNGGLFAIVQLSQAAKPRFPGLLSMDSLAVGGIAFTALMTYDIWRWGSEMRQGDMLGGKAYTRAGQMISLSICGLIMSGWFLAAIAEVSTCIRMPV